MNLVLADTEEFRRVKRKAAKSTAPGSSSAATLTETEEKRTLGLAIVRGAHIISLSVESPPPADPSARLGASAPGGASAALAAGTGIARPAGRGAPMGLAVCRLKIPYLNMVANRFLGTCCWYWRSSSRVWRFPRSATVWTRR